MTNTTAPAAPTTARAATLAVKRAVRAAGLDMPTVRSRNASPAMNEPTAWSTVFGVGDDLVAALRTIPGATVDTAYAERGQFLSVHW